MKITNTLIVIMFLAMPGCRKGDDPGGITGNGPLRLTTVKSEMGTVTISYNADGSIKGMPDENLRYFNGGLLMQHMSFNDTVGLDSANRLLYLKQDFDFGKRKKVSFFYDDLNRVIRTITNTGNGLNYLTDLTYSNGDVVDMVYNINTPGGNKDHFTYTYYDTLCVDQYPAIAYFGQVGLIQSRHLLKTTCYEQDTTFYSYVLDSNKRILVSYRNYDNSGWTYARAIDTAHYYYTR